jgi:hypothetical protein
LLVVLAEPQTQHQTQAVAEEVLVVQTVQGRQVEPLGLASVGWVVQEAMEAEVLEGLSRLRQRQATVVRVGAIHVEEAEVAVTV